MDPASAIIGIVSFGFTVVGQLNKIRKAIKDAPEQVQALQDSSVAVGLLLSRIQVTGGCSLSRSPQTNSYFESLRKRVEDCLKKVDETLQKVIARIPPDGDGNDEHKPRLNWRKWFKDKGVLADLMGKLADVRKVLCEMLEFLQVNYLEYIADRVENVELVVNTISAVQSYQLSRLEDIADRVGRFEHATIVTSTIQAGHFHSPPNIAGVIDDAQHNHCPSADLPKHEDNASINLSSVPHNVSQPPTKLRTRRPLKCPSNCPCRCHHPSISRLIPGWLAPYTGQVSISKRLLHPTFSSWLSLCNVQTCRGDLRRSMSLRWNSPLGLLHGSLQYIARDRQINFSLGARRTVSWDSPIVNTIFDGDLQGVRELFATGKASIWDYTIDGSPVFAYACNQWQRNLTEQHLGIIRLFTEAGAEALLLEETESAYSAHDTLIVGFFTYLLGETSDASQSLATVVRTNTAAIHIFRSILNMDPMDALEDYLDRKQARRVDVTGFMASLEGTTCNSEGRASVFKAINDTSLGYAIDYSPESVESLLADGEDAAAEPTLVYAVNVRRSELIKPLLDAGADVNMRDWRGHTALLVVCSRCRYYEFFELLRWAEDEIDWDACAPDGRNALELFDSAAQAGEAANLSQSEIDEFRAVLVAHMKFVEDVFNERLYMPGAFPDTL